MPFQHQWRSLPGHGEPRVVVGAEAAFGRRPGSAKGDVGTAWDASMVTTDDLDEPRAGGAAEALAIDVPGLIMRVRRTCDLSQRDLATAIGLDQSQVARIESARRPVDLPLLARILALAGYRIAILDQRGVEVTPVPADVLRDNAGRRMPAHLDVRPVSDRPMSSLRNPRSERPGPRAWYHHRPLRDRRRAGFGPGGVPDQPTNGGLAALERGRRAARRAVVQGRAPTLLDSACTCRDECWTNGRCGDGCACRCD